MRIAALMILGALCITGAVGAQAPAATRTMRLDYFHTGNTTQELFALDEVVIEPAPWSGSARGTSDTLNYGAYGFDVRDAASKTLLYSRGFGSIYDEWVTTEEAKTIDADVSRVAALPAADRAGHVSASASASPATGGATSGPSPSIRRTCSSTRRAPEPSPGPLIAIEQHGDPADQGRPAAARRRLHGGRAIEVRGRRASACSTCCSRPRRSRSAATTSTSGGWCRPRASRASRARRSGIHRANPVGCDLRRVRLGALRPDASTTRRSAGSPRSRPTTSSRSS